MMPGCRPGWRGQEAVEEGIYRSIMTDADLGEVKVIYEDLLSLFTRWRWVFFSGAFSV